MRRPWINSLWLLALAGLGVQAPAYALNCPQAPIAADKAIKEGIGAQWDEGQFKWYLDYFSAAKPNESGLKKFTFLQALYENNQLTCYYGWPTGEGSATSWMTVRLKTTQTVTPKWTGVVCQNFMAENCQFDLSGPVAPEPTMPTTTPGATTPTTPGATTPGTTTPTTPTTTPTVPESTTPPDASKAPTTPSSNTPSAPGTTPPAGNVTPPADKGADSKPLETPKL